MPLSQPLQPLQDLSKLEFKNFFIAKDSTEFINILFSGKNQSFPHVIAMQTTVGPIQASQTASRDPLG